MNHADRREQFPSESKPTSLAVWGLGYIGSTTAAALMDQGYGVVAVEPSDHRRQQITSGPLVLNSAHGLTIDFRNELASGQLILEPDPAALAAHSLAAHFLCFPTERDGVPYSEHLVKALGWIAKHSHYAPVVIESTISPRWVAELNLDARNVVVAPRRDWFHSDEHTLANLTRVCAASNPSTKHNAESILSEISPSIVWSDDLVAASASKAFENSIWFVLFTMVNELSANLDGVDFLEVLRLSETNWRTPFRFEPHYRVGGYCLPLSSRYIASLGHRSTPGADVSLVLEAATAANDSTAASIHAQVLEALGDRDRSVLVLGISYRPGIRVPTYSAGSALARMCVASGLDVLVHDPMYTDDELRTITGCTPVDIQDGLSAASCVVACTDHPEYRSIISDLSIPATVSVVLDSTGVFEDRLSGSGSVIYHRLGDNRSSD